jgi:hypothetical protein
MILTRHRTNDHTLMNNKNILTLKGDELGMEISHLHLIILPSRM